MDTTTLVADITALVPTIAGIGLASLGVYLAIKSIGWIKGGLK